MRKPNHQPLHPMIASPRGGGGNWLRLLISSLKCGEDLWTPRISTYYDGIESPMALDFGMTHLVNDGVYYKGNIDVMFATFKTFNNYANVVNKVINPQLDSRYAGFKDWDFVDKLNELVNLATSWLTGDNIYYYKVMKYENVYILDYELIFTNPLKFKANLYKIMDNFNIAYKKNDSIVQCAINDYILSCSDIMPMYYNFDDIVWVAWCIGIIDQYDIVFEEDLMKMDSMAEVVSVILPYKDLLNGVSKNLIIHNE